MPPSKKPKPAADLSRQGVRHVALRIAYLGTDYFGFSGFKVDTPDERTVERELFHALHKAKLIGSLVPADCNYAKCGRTDRGVHGFGQVVSLHVRSKLNAGPGVIKECEATERKNSLASCSLGEGNGEEGTMDYSKELNYPQMLNGLLPPDIRVLAWAPVDEGFSARFSCQTRVYHYYFFRQQLDVAAMREAAQLFLGEHDFRNFCKIDPVQTLNFRRSVERFDVEHVPGFHAACREAELGLHRFVIEGTAFLWHQVRCMTEVLFMVGRGEERGEVITALLDVAKHPDKPQYGFASEVPLILWDCKFLGVRWVYSRSDLSFLSRDFFSDVVLPSQMQLVIQSRMANMIDDLLDEQRRFPASSSSSSSSEARRKRHKHTPLLQRRTCPSVEERVSVLKGKKLADYQKKVDFLESVGWAEHPNKVRRTN